MENFDIQLAKNISFLRERSGLKKDQLVLVESYGHLIADIVDRCSGFDLQTHLWSIMAGHIENQARNDTSVNLSEEFMTFRDLIFLFDDIKAIREGREVKDYEKGATNR